MHYHYSRKLIFIQQKITNVHKILSQFSSCYLAFRDTRHVQLYCHVQQKSRSLQHHGCQLRLVYYILFQHDTVLAGAFCRIQRVVHTDAKVVRIFTGNTFCHTQPLNSMAAKPFRSFSAITAASFACMPGKTIMNSSPPQRPAI